MLSVITFGGSENFFSVVDFKLRQDCSQSLEKTKIFEYKMLPVQNVPYMVWREIVVKSDWLRREEDAEERNYYAHNEPKRFEAQK